jgi:glycosyltransferase involved in cell wall biosynthesis
MAPPRTFEVLIGALAELRGAGRDVVLRLVGDGPLRVSLERTAAELGLRDHVIFEGWKTQDQLRTLYCQADVFVFSSLAEGIPVVLMEAMAQGIPCVATRITGIPELIRDGLDGLLVETLDEQGTARAVARLMEDADLRRRMGLAAREHVLEEYNLQRNLVALAAIFSRRVGDVGPQSGGAVDVAGTPRS